jgi:hypothetical protein
MANDGKINDISQPRGLGSNPGLLIDSYEMKGRDGYTVYDNAYTTRAEVGFIGGEAVRADGPGKQIISTPWFNAGVIRDTMMIVLSYEFDETTTGTALASSTRFLEGKIYKRDPKTKEVIKTTEVSWLARTTVNKNPGEPNSMGDSDVYSTQFVNFTPQFEYKFEITTGAALQDHQSVIIDYMYLSQIPTTTWMDVRQVGFAGQSDSDLGGIPAIPVFEACPWSIPLNGSGDGNVTIKHYRKDSYIDNYQAYNYCYGTFNSIYGYAINTGSDNGSFSWNVTANTLTGYAGYVHTIYVNTNFGGGTLYGTLMIVGYRVADQL